MKRTTWRALTALALTLALWAPRLPAQAAVPAESSLDLAVATLTSLGVVNGCPDGGFHPEDGLDRSQFCKLAVLAGGYGDQLASTAYQTVFDDVSPAHWASPYINLACSLGLVSGYGDGRFGPDDPVTLGQAAKVLLGLLGYTAQEIGPFFPEDYLSRADALGLTQDMALQDAPLTRGDAALLLYRLLTLPDKEGRDFYARLGQSTVENVVLLDGAAGQVTDGQSVQEYLLAAPLDSALEGRRGALVLDQRSQVHGFVPREEGTLSLTLALAESDAVTDDTGRRYELDEQVTVIRDDQLIPYPSAWFSLRAGDQVTLYSQGGKVTLLLVRLREQAAGNQLVGRLENASPSLGRAALQLGETVRVTLDRSGQVEETVRVTLDRSGQVEDAVAVNSGESNVGLLTVNGEQGTLALPGATLSGTLADTTLDLSALSGSLVRARVNDQGELSISTLAAQTAPADLDLTARALGEAPLAPDAILYERVGAAPVQAISLEEILTSTVAAEDIEYVGYNAAGEVNLLLLQDVTGDRYTYGRLIKGSKTTGGGKMTTSNTTVTVENSDAAPTAWITGTPFQDESFGGVAGNAVTGKAAAVTALTPLPDLTRADFSGDDTLAGLPIAPAVQVYDAATQRWTTLAQAQTYAATFTAYYDRAPETGAQVRVIVAFP